MIEHHIDLQTADGAMNTFITHPEEGGPHPVIFFYMDAPGKREELHDMARRLGTVGYYVILPNLYYRETREFELDFGSDDSRVRMRELMYALGNNMIIRDTQTLFDYVDDDPAADSRNIGCVGYCMSGPFAFAMAGAYPDRIKAAASIYGVSLMTDRKDSPHLNADKIKGELYFACAETDDYAPKQMVDNLEAYLKQHNSNFRLEWYPGTHHGFAFPQRAMYDKQAAERHWERLFALFSRNLSSPEIK